MAGLRTNSIESSNSLHTSSSQKYYKSDDELLEEYDEYYAQSLSSTGSSRQTPLPTGMTNSNINITHSNNIQIGPRSMGSADASSLCTDRIGSSRDSLTSSGVSPIPFKNLSNLQDRCMNDLCSENERRRFSEGVTENLPPQYKVNVTSLNNAMDSQNNQKFLQKTMSTPSTSSEHSNVSSRQNNSVSVPPLLPSVQAVPPPQHPQSSSQTPMSAAVSNSSNVQMGTQYIIYFNNKEGGSQTPVPSANAAFFNNEIQSINASEAPSVNSEEYLHEFKEIIKEVYKNRTKSSPLPWHRGKQFFQINEYYTEPQIFSVDKFGNRTTQTVNLLSVLETDNETRFLVEGEAGMGKTFLAIKLAEEWAKSQRLQQFQILFLITLGDFKDSLRQYVQEELLPSYYKQENFEKIWEYCKKHDREIIFVFDGYDELQSHNVNEIQNIIIGRDFPKSKVVVMCRPNILQVWERKIVVSGFGQLQIMEFIEKYFKAIGNYSSGESLRKIVERDEKYLKLAKRPLFCVLLCMLYITGDFGQSLPERQSEVMLQIILCLIKWNRKNNSNAAIDFDSLPQEYEKPFFYFGKLCLEALEKEKSRFSEQEVQKVEGFEGRLKQLGFMYNDNESHALGEKKFWKPVHQTFLEYLGAFYMAKHIRECKTCKECKQYEVIFRRSPEVLKFCVGILGNKAHKMFDSYKYPFLCKLPVAKVLQLLKEAGPKQENSQAIAKLLDHSLAEISTSEIEFEGWSFILSQPFRFLSNLEITWRIKSRSPDQESSFTEASEAQYTAFFDALKSNESIKRIHVRAKQDGEPFTDEKISLFFTHLQKAFLKKNLREVEINDMKMTASGHLRTALEAVAYQQGKALQDLRVLKIHTFMKDEDLKGICEALQKCAHSLETLHLDGLEHGPEGFKSLVRLLKSNHNIQYLHVSMNQSLFVNVFGSAEETTNDYAPSSMRIDHQGMTRNAVRQSIHAYSEARATDTQSTASSEDTVSVMERKVSDGTEADPKKELAYLFENLSTKNGQWNLEANHYWALRRAKSELRIPLPVCVAREHKSVFHYLFSALPDTHVQNLTFNQSAGIYLSTQDLICLGNAVRKSSQLSVIDIQGLDKVKSYLPLMIGMGQSTSITSVNLSSSKVIVNDAAFEVICCSLQNNTSLRNLRLGKWQYSIKNVKFAQEKVSKLLGSWQVSLLDLRQSSIDATNNDSGSAPQSPVTAPLTAFFNQPVDLPSMPWRTIKNLNIEGVEFKHTNGLIRRGHLLLPGLTNFSCITTLNLSVSQSRVIQVDNIAIRKFFNLISTNLKHLSDLKLDYWEFNMYDKNSSNELSLSLKACSKLKKLQLQEVNELLPENVNGSSWCKNSFLHHAISYLPNLKDISLCNYKVNGLPLDIDTASKLATCLHDHFHNMPFTVTFFKYISPEVEKTIFENLKKPPCKAKKSKGSWVGLGNLIIIFKVKCPLSIIKRPH